MPSLEKDEYKRERDFYAERGMPCPKVCHFAWLLRTLCPSDIKSLLLVRILKRSKRKRTPSLRRRRLLQNQALHLTTTGLSLQLFLKSKYISSTQVRRASQSCAEELRPREAARVESKVCPSVCSGHHHSPQEVHCHQGPQHAQGWWGYLQVVGAWLLECLITHTS